MKAHATDQQQQVHEDISCLMIYRTLYFLDAEDFMFIGWWVK